MIKRIIVLASVLIAAACSRSDDIELKGAAIPNDPSVKVVRILDGSKQKFILISKNKGYELTCDNPQGLRNLLISTGYPEILIEPLPIRIDDLGALDPNSVDTVTFFNKFQWTHHLKSGMRGL